MVNILHLSGTNYEIGFKHGVLARSQIQACLVNYATYFNNAGMSPGTVKSLAAKFSTTIETLVPHLHDELRGIADGAEVPLYDIIALNARSEIALAAKPKKSTMVVEDSDSDDDEENDEAEKLPIPPDGCTTFAETVGTKQWLAQNWDWQTSQLCNLVFLEIETPKDSPSQARHLKTMTEAGLLAKVGINSEHVGVCLNALRATNLNTNLLPLHVLLRLVLESKSVADAKSRIETQYGGGAACWGHFGVADGKEDGHAQSWELGPEGIFVINRDDKRRLYHTNHVLEDRPNMNEVIWLVDTKERYERIKELATEYDEKGKPVSSLTQTEQKERIFGFLKDEDNYPNSICRANDESQPGLLGEMQTVFSIVMDLTEDMAWVVVGRPKQVLETFKVSF
ncbi:acyl-coenzyme A:6-aminopenicillanic acid acyl-transferase-domain-containing protein [Limtongia smithiae]|uniref:acyl-coenzyme A:6-aminopenicillanic acid acyl-transferase-domain-containing protein n=1 Tax=Limtongia smithiae TaxID=1125753 RepID=UPI0034CDFA35